jgi:predicted DNA-binding transcriptional regulator AlpA
MTETPKKTVNNVVLLRQDEVATILRTSPQTLANHRSLGVGIPYIRLGRSVRYLKSDVEDYIMRNRIPSDSSLES